MDLAVAHLVALGHRRIALIAPDFALAASDWYVDGFLAASATARLELLDGGIVASGRRDADGEAASG
jgi:DNA-binding LacI/PurR family transcriptional regulator